MGECTVPVDLRVEDVDCTDLDELPFGVVVLDAEATVVAYNLAESTLARRARNATLGKNFFSDVAPCASVRAFRGRFDAFLQGERRLGERFHFRFRFSWATVPVVVQFVRLAQADRCVVVIDRDYE
jgi:photoactive yellow protein